MLEKLNGEKLNLRSKTLPTDVYERAQSLPIEVEG